MTTQAWEAHVRPSILGVRLIAARRQQSEAWLTPDEIPAEVREFLELGVGNMVAVGEAPNLAALQALVANQPGLALSRPDEMRLDWSLSFSVIPPAEPREPICIIDVDEARYEGDDKDGIYYDAAEGEDGWYLSAIVDCDSAGFVDTFIQDDGPYESYDAAMSAGLDAARDWCVNNGIDYGSDE